MRSLFLYSIYSYKRRTTQNSLPSRTSNQTFVSIIILFVCFFFSFFYQNSHSPHTHCIYIYHNRNKTFTFDMSFVWFSNFPYRRRLNWNCGVRYDKTHISFHLFTATKGSKQIFFLCLLLRVWNMDVFLSSVQCSFQENNFSTKNEIHSSIVPFTLCIHLSLGICLFASTDLCLICCGSLSIFIFLTYLSF